MNASAIASAIGTITATAIAAAPTTRDYRRDLPPGFHELSFAEVAVIAECSEDSAKVNYHHGVKRLRTSVPPAEGD